jgi:hypothetical protein
VSIACEFAEVDEPVEAAADPELSEEELVERLKDQFGAREVFDEPEA